ncbi:hypothetical protein HZQ19_01250 [Elizabethkingia anophelis]|uniref:hypothetical protein n=1 Tax=Elizabethkingia anophelis TaxID=1117645 RepID=UPI000C9AC638|nr:hypothetical protein [Elizabethkingia anophelis]MCT3758326.1 hypothetical protein [Elizabethkingia anophelis]MCT3972026.1 hypothetical protein [Elizabethkingia anophelis]MCT4000503.1 hypothetical protein [Elizabethkingia anophelis]MCT4014516.1 hypothetical protein [Elizabethkingia anophelis]MCT4018077.1 hypothetical protein [Elizabethkingia anophelis]
MNYYHKEELSELSNCPPSDYTPKNTECYRWVFADINDERNFQSQAHKNPKGLNDKSDFGKCEYFALSFHASYELNKKHYEILKKRFKNIPKNIGTHLAKGKIASNDGIGSEIDELSHFNFHFIVENNFCNKFEIIEEL